jgi:hypothetical protein
VYSRTVIENASKLFCGRRWNLLLGRLPGGRDITVGKNSDWKMNAPFKAGSIIRG